MSAGSLGFVGGIILPKRRQTGDIEASLPSEASSNADSDPNERKEVEQSDPEVADQALPEIQKRTRSQDKIGEEDRTPQIGSPNALTRFRSLPVPKPPKVIPKGPPVIQYQLERKETQTSVSSASTESEFASAGPPTKWQLLLAKVKNFIKQRGQYDDDINIIPEYRWQVYLPYSFTFHGPFILMYVIGCPFSVVFASPSPSYLKYPVWSAAGLFGGKMVTQHSQRKHQTCSLRG